MASWELKTEANISKMYKKLILKTCCSFVATSVSILILKKKIPSYKPFLNDYCLITWQAISETLAL